MELLVFYFFAALVLGGGVFILFTKNLMYAALALFVTFLGIAALYVYAFADFLAVAQIMIYVGGVLVLILFGIMLTNATRSVDSEQTNRIRVQSGSRITALLLSSAFFVAIFLMIGASNYQLIDSAVTRSTSVRLIGTQLMTSHLLPFEIAAVLLLVVLIGAAYIAFNRNTSNV